MEKDNLKEKILSFLRLESNIKIKWTIGGIFFGFILYILLAKIDLPKYTYTGLNLGITVIPITGGIDLGLVIIIITAALSGPLAGFIVGFFGGIVVELLFTSQIVAFGGVSLSFGILGLIVGIPCYTDEEGFADGKRIGKLMLFILVGYLVMTLFFLISLIVIANQSFEGTLLYNFAPNFSIFLISLFIFAPTLVRIIEIVINQGIKLWETRSQEVSFKKE